MFALRLLIFDPVADSKVHVYFLGKIWNHIALHLISVEQTHLQFVRKLSLEMEEIGRDWNPPSMGRWYLVFKAYWNLCEGATTARPKRPQSGNSDVDVSSGIVDVEINWLLVVVVVVVVVALLVVVGDVVVFVVTVTILVDFTVVPDTVDGLLVVATGATVLIDVVNEEEVVARHEGISALHKMGTTNRKR
jgi:hypothetical protein